MVGGAGYGDLVVAELARDDRFGREDGVLAARWDESPAVRAALIDAVEPRTDDTYRQVVVMEALAIHRADALLEAMIRGGSPVYVNAAEMRCAPGRETESLRLRVEGLVAQGTTESVETAASLAGFLGEPDEAHALISVYLDPATTRTTRHTIIATFKALDVYLPELLPIAREFLLGAADEDAQFVASYLAYVGDAEARAAVCEWLEQLDLGTWSTSRHAYLAPLRTHADSREAVVRFLLRSRVGAQEAFLRLAQSEQSRSEPIARPRAFLRQVARNLLRDRAKSASGRGELLHVPFDEDAISAANEVSRLEARDSLARVEAVMRRMKPKTREIFMAHRLDGLSYNEIAERTGMSVSGVEKQMAKAMTMLLQHAGRD